MSRSPPASASVPARGDLREQTGSAPRRRKASRRAEILQAARAVFQASGFDGASMGEIAAQAGCVEGTIYTYFRNKRALFDSVMEAFYEGLIADITPRLSAIVGTRERLVFLVERHLRIALEDPGMSRLINAETWGIRSYYGSALHALNRRYSRLLSDTLRDGVRDGELVAGLDVQIARDLVLGGIHHWVWNAINREQAFDSRDTAIRFVDTLASSWFVPMRDAAFDELAARVTRLERLAADSNDARGEVG